MLAPPLTLLENLILAREPIGRGGLIDWRAARARGRGAGGNRGRRDRLATCASPTRPVHVRQILEILRLLYRGADVLILDEPTAVLAPAQVDGTARADAQAEGARAARSCSSATSSTK